MNTKAAIELSVNVIVVIVISVVIIVAGFALLAKMRSGAQNYVDTVDSQTQEKIKAMMLNSDQRVAVYPRDLTLSRGDSQLVGVGISNDANTKDNFTIDASACKYFDSAGKEIATGCGTNIQIQPVAKIDVDVGAKSQESKGILFSVAKSAPSGEYVYTISVKNSTSADYGVSKVYIIVN